MSIEWITPSSKGRGAIEYFIAISTTVSKKKRNSIAIFFSAEAMRQFRWQPGDRVAVGFDEQTVYLKRVPEEGYKICGKKGKNCSIRFTQPKKWAFEVQNLIKVGKEHVVTDSSQVVMFDFPQDREGPLS